MTQIGRYEIQGISILCICQGVLSRDDNARGKNDIPDTMGTDDNNRII